MLKVIEHFLRVDVDQTPKTNLAARSAKLQTHGRLIAKTSSDLTKTNEEGNISLEKNVAVPVCELSWLSGACASNNYQRSADNGSAGAARRSADLCVNSSHSATPWHLPRSTPGLRRGGANTGSSVRINKSRVTERTAVERGVLSSRVTSVLVGQTKDERLWLREVKGLYYYRGWWIFYLET